MSAHHPISLNMPTAQSISPPILFIIFNRPETTAQVLEAIRAAQPSRLYVAIDGPRPRNLDDVKNITACKTVIESIDWACQLQLLENEKNKGCKEAVRSALDWFFENEPEGIILEDDCLPHPTFFDYCAHHLEQHRGDPSIATLSGTRLLHKLPQQNGSGDLSKFFTCWGWASWREVWQQIRAQDFRSVSAHALLGLSSEVSRYYQNLAARCGDPSKTSWDYEVSLASLQLGQLHILPPVNLIINLGFSKQSTHTNQRPPHAPISFGSTEQIKLEMPLQKEDPASELAFVQTQFQPFYRRWLNRIRYGPLLTK